MFSLKLMSKGEIRCGMDPIVRGLRKIVQPFRVSINAKGRDCWHVLQKECACHLWKKNNNDGEQEKHKLMRTREQYKEIKSWKEKRKLRVRSLSGRPIKKLTVLIF
jgi:hypothetical protein